MSAGVPFTMVLAVEGQPTIDGRLIEPGGLRWDKVLGSQELSTIPVMMDGRVIGIVEKVWREGGIIRASGSFLEDRVPDPEKPWEVGITLYQMESSRAEVDILTLKSGQIRSVTVYTDVRAAWPEVVIESIGEWG
ncbi:hypothetical protein PBI_DEWDROP_133 [Microbacterium phage Dewdrop]|nr:hypothetical protein PBI_LEAF_133 [Microbacterium phage Leaf]QGZ17501.1 hypothetical protein PBI_DEWDROP_133 [Microbacterium phage Dewdrop]